MGEKQYNITLKPNFYYKFLYKKLQNNPKFQFNTINYNFFTTKILRKMLYLIKKTLLRLKAN